MKIGYWALMMLPLGLCAQDSNILDTYVARALSNNLSMRSISLSESRQQSKVDQARKLWQPNVDLNASYLFAEGGRKILFPIGDLFNPTYGALNRLTASNDFPTDLENVETQLTPNNFLDASLSISKPLINSAIKYNVLIQQALVSLADVDRDIQKNELAFQVRQSYYNYAKTIQGEEVLRENIALLNEVLTFNKKLIKYDKATPDVVTDIEYQVALLNSQVDGLREQQQLSKVLFNTILNQDLDEDIIIDTSLIYNVIPNTSSLDVLVDRALASRPEFRKLDISSDVNELNVQRIKKGSQPTLGVSGAVGVQTEAFSFDDGGPLYTLGFSMAWNLWDGGLRKKQTEELVIAREEINLETEIARQQITLQVSQAYHQLRGLYAQLEAQLAAITAAQSSYRAISNRYRNSKALLIELLSAQNKVVTSRLNKILLQMDIHIAQAALDRVVYNN